jgi:hypothetical protein
MRRLVTAVLALALLLGLFLGDLRWAVGLLALWLLWLGLGLRSPLRRLIGSPRLWLFTAALACLAGFFLGPKDLELFGLGCSTQGFLAGIWMLVRGTALFSVFSVAAMALTQGKVLGLLPRLGLGGTAEAVRAAVTALPQMQERLRLSVLAPDGRRLGFKGFRGRLEAAAVLLLREAMDNATKAPATPEKPE